MSIPDSSNENSLSSSIASRKFINESPINSRIQSGIYRAITTGEPDPEGRGRLSAYIPKLGGDPENPMYFQYAAPFGGSNRQGSYGFFMSPPDAGITVLVFFAENGEISEGYYFAVSQEVPNVAAGGPAGRARRDGSGQGEGAFSNTPSADLVPPSISTLRNPGATSSGEQGDGLRGNENTDSDTPWNIAEAQRVENLFSQGALNNPDAYERLSPGERAYAIQKGYIQSRTVDTTDDARAERNIDNTNDDPDARDPRNENQNTLPNHGRNVNVSNQGIYTDSVRGQTTASPIRNASYETPQPNSVFGLRTPGSNAITMDDGNISPEGDIHPNQIRIQTGSGASVILDGTNDLIYVVNSTGSGWVEIGAEGEIMAYAQGSISMRAEKDFNIRADQNINMEAGSKVNIKSGNNFSVNSGNQTHMKSEGSQFYDSGGSNHTNVSTNMYVSTGNDLHLNGPQAAASPMMPTISHPDIQDGSSTQVDESITSTMPSHEPMMRSNPGVAGSPPGGDNSSSGVIPDPNSSQGQDDAVNTDETTAPEDVIDDGQGGSIEYRNQNATRSQKLDPRLESILLSAANATDLHVVIFSGGQPSSGPNRTGSHRHDNGFAADIWLYQGRGGRQLSMINDSEIVSRFAAAAKSAGALSIGAGHGYMGGVGMHVDIAPGNSIPIQSARYWGTNSRSAGAPGWLRSIMV